MTPTRQPVTTTTHPRPKHRPQGGDTGGLHDRQPIRGHHPTLSRHTNLKDRLVIPRPLPFSSYVVSQCFKPGLVNE